MANQKFRTVFEGQDNTGRAFRSIHGNVDKTRAKFALLGTAIAGVATGALVQGIRKAVDLADSVDKVAQTTGLTVEALQKYRFAASQSGVDTKLFDSVMGAFAKRVGEARQGIGPLVSGLKFYDTQLLENIQNSRNQQEALLLVVDAINNQEDAALQAAIANAAFSRAGLRMVNFAELGRDGIGGLGDELERLGGVLTGDTIQAAADAQDAMDKFRRVFDASIATAILKHADLIVGAADNATLAVKALSDAVSDLKTIGQTINGLMGEDTDLGKLMNFVARNTPQLNLGLAFRDAIVAGAEGIQDTTGSGLGGALSPNVATNGKPGYISVTDNTGGIHIPGDPNESLSPKKTPERFFDVGADLDVWLELDRVMARNKDLQEKALEIKRNIRTESELINDKEAELNELLTRNLLTQEQADAEMMRFKSTLDQATDSSDAFAASLQGAFENAILQARGFGGVLDVIKQKLLSSFLFGDDGGGGLLGGAFKSFSKSIGGLGKSLFGFNDGGSFEVGGSGGIDSNIVAFKASRGETVNIEPSHRGGGSASGATIVQHIHFDATLESMDSRIRSSAPIIAQQAVNAVRDQTQRTAGSAF